MDSNLPYNRDNKKEDKGKKDTWWGKLPIIKKLKSIKNIEIIIAVLIICVMLLIYFSSIGGGKSSSNPSTVNDIKYTDAETYVKDLETRIGSTLSKIDGAGEVSVVITLSSSSEFIIAKDVEQTTHTEIVTENGVTTSCENGMLVIKAEIEGTLALS